MKYLRNPSAKKNMDHFNYIGIYAPQSPSAPLSHPQSSSAPSSPDQPDLGYSSHTYLDHLVFFKFSVKFSQPFISSIFYPTFLSNLSKRFFEVPTISFELLVLLSASCIGKF